MNIIDLIDLTELKKQQLLVELVDHHQTLGLSDATISIIILLCILTLVSSIVFVDKI